MHVCACTRPRARIPTCTRTHAHADQYVILIAFPQQQWLRERASKYVIRTLPVSIKSPSYARLLNREKRPVAHSATGRFSLKFLYWRLLWKSIEKMQIFFKSSKNGTLYVKTCYVLLLPVKLSRFDKSDFEWNGARLLGYPRKNKHYATALQCYVTGAVTILLTLLSIPLRFSHN